MKSSSACVVLPVRRGHSSTTAGYAALLNKEDNTDLSRGLAPNELMAIIKADIKPGGSSFAMSTKI